MKVSIIIPTYKRSENIKRAINSILSSDIKNIEIIVVDDNGQGTFNQLQTQDYLSEYINEKRILYIANERNLGGGGARNEGVKFSTGEVIGFLDDDDEYLPGKIQHHLNDFLSGFDISLCSMQVINEDGKKIDTDWSIAKGESLEDFIVQGNAYTPMIMVRKNTIIESGGFENVKMFQDHILMLNLLKVTNKIKVTNKKFFIHNVHSGERVSKNLSMESLIRKQNLETCFFYALTKKEIDKVKLKHIKERAIFLAANKKWVEARVKCLEGMKYIKNIESAKYFLKSITRVFLGSRIYSVIEGIRNR